MVEVPGMVFVSGAGEVRSCISLPYLLIETRI